MKNYIVNVLIGFDQFVNTLIGGYPDETLSSRAWREKETSKFWKAARVFIDWLFFFQNEHCYSAYLSEVNRKQINLEQQHGRSPS